MLPNIVSCTTYGMKGALSEMELSTLRQRSYEALRQKARRGELFLNVAVGYVKVRRDRIEQDPDRRVQAALDLVFRKFAEFQSIRQVHRWLREEEVALPAVQTDGEERRIVWKPPVYKTVHALLTSPIYAGAYAFGRTGTRVTIENGRKRVTVGSSARAQGMGRIDRGSSRGLRFVGGVREEPATDRRQRQLPGPDDTWLGAPRRGVTRGMLRCGQCGRRLHVHYSGASSACVSYGCRGAQNNHGTRGCISFGGARVDAVVGAEVVRLISPLGMEAALEAVAMRECEHAETRRQAELALTQARYETDLARRQYDAVDPSNRLVAAELERRWNDRLAEVHHQEERLAATTATGPDALSAAEKDRLRALGGDLEKAWSHPGATVETRKRIVRAVLEVGDRCDRGRRPGRAAAALARWRSHPRECSPQPEGTDSLEE